MTPVAPQPKEPEKEAQGGIFEFLLSAGSAAVVGIGSAIVSIRHNFYTESKNWEGASAPDLKHLRESRIQQQKFIRSECEAIPDMGARFTKFITRTRDVEKNFTADFGRKLESSTGIHSHGFKGLTVGTLQRWQASGPHTRANAVISLIAGSAVTLGAVLALKNRNMLRELNEQQDEQQSKGR